MVSDETMNSFEQTKLIKENYDIENKYHKTNSKFFSLSDLKLCDCFDEIRIQLDDNMIEGQMYEIYRITNDEIVLNREIYPSLILNHKRYHKIIIPFDSIKTITFDYHRENGSDEL